MSTPTEKENYSKTLKLPETEFPMRGDLPKREPEILKKWEEKKQYQKMIAKNKGKTKFVFHDGPPYANGDIHLGHVLNKVLKDIVVKYKNMQGFHTEFIPGWDCHGLPIEHKVSKELGEKRKDKTKKDIRALCRAEAQKWVGIQRDQFKRLGILADWEDPYLTLHPNYEAEEVRELGRMLKNKVLYRGEKPVFWCPTLQTALADTEVEYRDHKSPSIYVKFEIAEESLKALGLPAKTSVVIWTTTPWTLPANFGISFHPDFEYAYFDSSVGPIVIAKELKEAFEKATETTLGDVKKTFKGTEFENLKALHPFLDRTSLFVLGQHVTLDAGTGCVHTAPGHGVDDYNVGLKYGLPVFSPVDEAGNYTEEYPEMQGQNIFKANPVIIEKLKESGHLIHVSYFTHSYPHNWRSKTPLIYRATPQWFIRVDDEKFNIRQKALQSIENEIAFVPAWGQARLKAMVENRPDWCISRQRIWGVPIPVFFCDSCNEALVKEDIINDIADKMEKGQGIEEYFEAPKGTFTKGHTCEKCGGQEFTASQDILDVWFDSGVGHAAVQAKREGLSVPADIYLEGSDQHRGWFQTSLLTSMASRGSAPFKALVTHGFLNDEKGYKMSKSLGNTIDPSTVFKQNGAEILRLWVAYEDFGKDVSVGPEILKRVTETYRRIRNTMRFLLGNTKYIEQIEMLKFEELDSLDRWILHKLNQLIKDVTAHYDQYNFYRVYHAVNQFFTVDLSAYYLDIIKDRLYCEPESSLKRRSSLTALYHITNDLTKMLAPILSFLAEEIHPYLSGPKADTIWEESFPQFRTEWNFEAVATEFDQLMAIRSNVTKVLEDLRKEKVIGSSLEARVTITLAGEDFKLATKYEDFLEELFIVSQVQLAEGPESVKAEKYQGNKCARCWKIKDAKGMDKNREDVCQRCAEALV
ncbi:MAG: isoleucine--tRNA ligase [Bdellovibrionaceae bacterium]|nr:isoleucine--tRNA ligase [Pseudobdellovibrionaceae bacterium]